MVMLRRIGQVLHWMLLLAVVTGSCAYLAGAGWQELLGMVPACQGDVPNALNLHTHTCISGQEPSGLAWYGIVIGVVLWLALLRWSATSAALRVTARTAITLGTGIYAATLIRGDDGYELNCHATWNLCPQTFLPLTWTMALVGLLLGAAVGFALIPIRLSVAAPEAAPLRRTRSAAHTVLLLGVLVGSGAYLIGGGWRELVRLAPACVSENLDTCISGQQQSGLGWYGAAFGGVLWLAMLRWGETRATVRVAARTVITIGTGLFAAVLFHESQARALVCVPGRGGECLRFIDPLTLTEAALGLAYGAAVAFALIQSRPRSVTGDEATARSLDRALGRRVAFVAAAIVIAAFGASLGYLYAKQADRAPVGGVGPEVLVASHPIPAGTTGEQALAAGLLDIESIPSEDILAGAVVDIEPIAGHMALVDISPGQQLLTPLFGVRTNTAVRIAAGLPDEELDDMEARALAASPGPWWSSFDFPALRSSGPYIGRGLASPNSHPYLRLTPGPGERVTPHDFDFIAGARQDVPRLVAEVRRLRQLAAYAEVRRLRQLAASSLEAAQDRSRR